MRLVFTPHGWEDYSYWLSAGRATLKRINRLTGDGLRDPSTGIGKPEPLRHLLAGAWSRRISEEHRLHPAVSLSGAFGRVAGQRSAWPDRSSSC